MDWNLILTFLFVIGYFAIAALFGGYAQHKFWSAPIVICGALFWPFMIPVIGGL